MQLSEQGGAGKDSLLSPCNSWVGLERPLDLESRDQGSILSSVIGQLCDSGQVTLPF